MEILKKFNIKNEKILPVCAISVLALSAIVTVLRIFSILFFYDKNIAYYTVGAALPVISNVIYAVSIVLFALVCIFAIGKDTKIPSLSKTSRFIALVPAAATLYAGLDELSDILTVSQNGSKASYLSIFTCVFAFSTMAFFISLLFSKPSSTFSVISGIGGIAWLILIWVRSYTDFLVPMNSPDKMLLHFGCVGAALFLIAEIRILDQAPKAKLYCFSLFAAILSLGIASIPAIIGYFTNTFAVYETLTSDVAFIAILVYAASRAIDIARFKTEEN